MKLFGSNLFKSKAQRRQERETKFRECQRTIEKRIAIAEAEFNNHRELAVEAKQNHSAQLEGFKAHMLETRRMIRSLNEFSLRLRSNRLIIEQAEATVAFARAIRVATRDMDEWLNDINIKEINNNYDSCRQKEKILTDRMDEMFEQMDDIPMVAQTSVDDMAEIEQLIDDDVYQKEQALLGNTTHSGLRQGMRS